ncbi:MAG: hypothetical protein ABIJ31_00565 [Pseudomonadota bacterium]
MEKTGSFYFDPDDAIYADHFPGSPVVPGSLIVHAFCRVIEKQGLGWLTSDSFQVEKFRFERFVTPGEYQYTLQFADDGAVSPGECRVGCSLYDGQNRVARGTMIV